MMPGSCDLGFYSKPAGHNALERDRLGFSCWNDGWHADQRLPTGIMLCTAVLHSAAADNTRAGEKLHAAVTDMPDVIYMSHAEPKTWHSLLRTPSAYDGAPASLRAELTTKSAANGRG
jgi:hypothetical protein